MFRGAKNAAAGAASALPPSCSWYRLDFPPRFDSYSLKQEFHRRNSSYSYFSTALPVGLRDMVHTLRCLVFYYFMVFHNQISFFHMQHNLLSNFLTFHTTLDSERWLRILSHLTTMPLTKCQPYKFEYCFVKNRNNIKTTFNYKEKIIRQEFDMTIIKNKEFAFIKNKEKNGLVGNPKGSMVITDQSFVQTMMGNTFPGEKTLVDQKQILLQGLFWENYLIFYTNIPNDRILLIIQEINGGTCFALGNKYQDLHERIFHRIKTFFEPIIYQIFGAKECQEEMVKYNQFLKENSLEVRPQMLREVQEKDFLKEKEKGKIQVDFTLLFFLALSQAFQQTDN